jgi:xylulokinase
VGIHPDIETAAKTMSGTSSSFEPDAARVGVYQNLYDAYRKIYPALRDIFPAISESLRVD